MTEAVFFDVGSTLIRPCPSVAETFARVAAERGHDLTVRDVEPHMPAMDAYYEAEYLRDGDFWCSHEGSTAIWLDQYRYVCHLAGIGHDAEGVAQTVHEAYRRAECWETYADVTACLRALKERGYALGVVSNWDAGLEGLLRDLRLLPYFDTVVSRRWWATASRTRSSSTWLASRWACAPNRACMWAIAPMPTGTGRPLPASAR